MKFLVLLSMFLSLPTFAGNDGGSGGDSYAKEFEEIARELHVTFQKNSNDELLKKWNLKPSLFELAINKTLLRSAEGEDVILDGYEVDAINYRNPAMILINNTRWRERNLIQKIELVLHEYLGVLGIELGNYVVTNEFKKFILETHQRVKVSTNIAINIYRGYVQLPPSVGSSKICDTLSDRFVTAQEQAKDMALKKCAAEKKNCTIHHIEEESVISTKFIGYKYCAITATAK